MARQSFRRHEEVPDKPNWVRADVIASFLGVAPLPLPSESSMRDVRAAAKERREHVAAKPNMLNPETHAFEWRSLAPPPPEARSEAAVVQQHRVEAHSEQERQYDNASGGCSARRSARRNQPSEPSFWSSSPTSPMTKHAAAVGAQSPPLLRRSAPEPLPASYVPPAPSMPQVAEVGSSSSQQQHFPYDPLLQKSTAAVPIPANPVAAVGHHGPGSGVVHLPPMAPPIPIPQHQPSMFYSPRMYSEVAADLERLIQRNSEEALRSFLRV